MNYFHKECPALRSAIDRFFAELGTYNETHCGGKLSVILLGSLSRGEATWTETDTGVSMLSDIEFFTVYDQGFEDFASFDRGIRAAAEHAFPDQTSILFHIDNTYVCRERLGSMERKLLTYDAKQMGKTVVGPDAVCLLPQISLDNINLWDIRDILTHRMFSVLYYGLPLKNQGELTQYRYSLAKNSLDLMTVLLCQHQKIASGFANRLELVKQLPVEDRVKAYFSYCLAVKLGEEEEEAFSIEQMEEMFLSLTEQLRRRFRVPLKNTAKNAKHVLRRVLGIAKRAVRYKHIPHPGHLKTLIARFEQKQLLTKKDLKNNLVLNGYPLQEQKVE